MRYYRSLKGSLAVEINDCLYQMTGKATEHGLVLGHARQGTLVREGKYGSLMQAFALACDERQVPVRYGYHGIVNELGDMGDVYPPCKPVRAPFPDNWIEEWSSPKS